MHGTFSLFVLKKMLLGSMVSYAAVPSWLALAIIAGTSCETWIVVWKMYDVMLWQVAEDRKEHNLRWEAHLLDHKKASGKIVWHTSDNAACYHIYIYHSMPAILWYATMWYAIQFDKYRARTIWIELFTLSWGWLQAFQKARCDRVIFCLDHTFT